jgi:hypothetical protein
MMIDFTKVMFNSKRWEDRFGAINSSILIVENFFKENKQGYLDSELTDFVWNHIRGERIQ